MFNKITEFLNDYTLLEKGDITIIGITYKDDKFNEILKAQDFVITVDICCDCGIKYHKIIYKDFCGLGTKKLKKLATDYN